MYDLKMYVLHDHSLKKNVTKPDRCRKTGRQRHTYRQRQIETVTHPPSQPDTQITATNKKKLSEQNFSRITPLESLSVIPFLGVMIGNDAAYLGVESARHDQPHTIMAHQDVCGVSCPYCESGRRKAALETVTPRGYFKVTVMHVCMYSSSQGQKMRCGKVVVAVCLCACVCV